MVNYHHLLGPKSVAKIQLPETAPGIIYHPSKPEISRIEISPLCKRLKKIADSPYHFLDLC
jgi:hypothetical protein